VINLVFEDSLVSVCLINCVNVVLYDIYAVLTYSNEWRKHAEATCFTFQKLVVKI